MYVHAMEYYSALKKEEILSFDVIIPVTRGTESSQTQEQRLEWGCQGRGGAARRGVGAYKI